jgi:hypothetical protein
VVEAHFAGFPPPAKSNRVLEPLQARSYPHYGREANPSQTFSGSWPGASSRALPRRQAKAAKGAYSRTFPNRRATDEGQRAAGGSWARCPISLRRARSLTSARRRPGRTSRPGCP